MIMGHIQFSAPDVGFDKWIHSFHMPLFFVVSGYLFRSIDLKQRLYRRFRTLIVPYLFFGVAHIILYSMLSRSFNTHMIYILLYENTAEGGVAIAGALWFLTALFIADMLYAVIDKVAPSKIGVFISFGVMLIGLVIASFTNLHLPYGLSAALVGVGFIELGRQMKSKYNKLEELPIICVVIVIIVGSIITMLNGYINLRTGNYGIWPLFLLSALLMIVGIWNIAKRLDRFLAFREVKCKWLYNIGEASIVFLCCNQLMILIVSYIVRHGFHIDLYGELTPLVLMIKILTLIVVLAILSIISVVFNRKPLNAILGK